MLLVLALDLAIIGRLTLLFDIGFVLLCVGAALAVHPRDFFHVGVLPPLLLLGFIALLALVHRGWIAEAGDGLVQAVVSGLAHRASALLAATCWRWPSWPSGSGCAWPTRAATRSGTGPRRRPGHHGRAVGEVDDGGRLRPALAGVDHRVQPADPARP